ncbi:MAG: tRNA pseudouridine(55) synthase TruB [Legionellaceae bacterium]|nr:tRNA pseudouridine(55) synthase TruB [Legionellaceae bacterium]
MHGILLVDKPLGLSSNAVLQQVKRLFAASKAGHTGSLDPLATGMLPICLGEATKFAQYLLDADKAYETTGQLGVKTSTGDAEGEIIEVCESFSFSEVEVISAVAQFQGEIVQTPSIYSAIKHKGKPSYIYARQGKEVPQKSRQVHIHSNILTEWNQPYFSLQVHCSKGTYIRSLVEDIGRILDCGAHVVRLHRKHTAGYENAPMYSLERLREAGEEERKSWVLPIETMVRNFPEQIISLAEIKTLHYGQVVRKDFTLSGTVRLHTEEGVFVGLGSIREDGLYVQRLLNSITCGI